MTNTHAATLGLILLVLAACRGGATGTGTTTSPTTSEATASLAELLEQIAEGKREAGDLEVTYDDMHGLHGGETITLRGDGSLTAVRRDPPDSPQTEHTVQVSPEQLLEIVQLVVDIEGWKQEVPERVLVPDESTARLGLRGAGFEGGMWEFYNDLEGFGRLVRVKRALEALAFPTP